MDPTSKHTLLYSHPFILSVTSLAQLDPVIHNMVGISINMTKGPRGKLNMGFVEYSVDEKFS